MWNVYRKKRKQKSKIWGNIFDRHSRQWTGRDPGQSSKQVKPKYKPPQTKWKQVLWDYFLKSILCGHVFVCVKAKTDVPCALCDEGHCSAFGSLLLHCVTKKCKTGSWLSLLPLATEHWQFLKLTVVIRAGNTIMLCNLGRTYVKCLIIMYNFSSSFIFGILYLGSNLITFKIIGMEIFVIAFSSKKAN